jgi:hypothetical protein
MAPQQHAIWIQQAREHLQEHRPQMFARLTETGKLDEWLTVQAKELSNQMQTLMHQGAQWTEAWEQASPVLFPPPEAGSEPEMPETEGFKAHRELIQGLNNLRMPGEKEE